MTYRRPHRQVARGCFAIAIGVLVAGCAQRPILDRHWPDAYWRHGPYVLIAVDTETQMALCVDNGRGEPVTLVGPTVFAVGANDRFVVVKQHPATGHGHVNLARTHFYVVSRDTTSFRSTRTGLLVRGPLTEDQYRDLGRLVPLPRFVKVFRTLGWQQMAD